MRTGETGSPPVYGLVLAGGQSRRMGRDKTALSYRGDGRPQWRVAAETLAAVGARVFLSTRPGQTLAGEDESPFQRLPDAGESLGPMTGLVTAMRAHPGVAWLAVASDLPLLCPSILEDLLAARGEPLALAYRSRHDGLPEPLCALYEPGFAPILERHLAEDRRCPRKVLILESAVVGLLDLAVPEALENANTPEDFDRLTRQLSTAP